MAATMGSPLWPGALATQSIPTGRSISGCVALVGWGHRQGLTADGTPKARIYTMLTLKLPHTFSVLLAAVHGAWKRNLMKVDKVCCYRLGDLPVSQTKYMY